MRPSTMSWFATGLALAALLAAGTITFAGRDLTRERLVEALESIENWDAGGAMPAVSFSSSDHHAQPAGFVCELDGGRFKALSGWIEP